MFVYSLIVQLGNKLNREMFLRQELGISGVSIWLIYYFRECKIYGAAMEPRSIIKSGFGLKERDLFITYPFLLCAMRSFRK